MIRMSFSRFIKQDLLASIRAGTIASDGLTVGSLSKRYRVSATPVRVAVRELIDERYLKKGDNGRLVVRTAGQFGSDSSPKKPTDWGHVVANDLVRLSLEGAPVL